MSDLQIALEAVSKHFERSKRELYALPLEARAHTYTGAYAKGRSDGLMLALSILQNIRAGRDPEHR